MFTDCLLLEMAKCPISILKARHTGVPSTPTNKLYELQREATRELKEHRDAHLFPSNAAGVLHCIGVSVYYKQHGMRSYVLARPISCLMCHWVLIILETSLISRRVSLPLCTSIYSVRKYGLLKKRDFSNIS